MRRRRSSAPRRLLISSLLLFGGVRDVAAQSGTQVEGALELVLPIGARTLGMGQAAAASGLGSEALWWNPALIARGSREVALHDVAPNPSYPPVTDVAIAIVYPVRRVGAFALSVRYLNEGEQQATVGANTQSGTFVPTSKVFGATFATAFTDRLSGGLTYKLLLVRFECTGTCDLPANQPTTAALDFGAQYLLTKDSSVVLGAALRNLGPPLQINDAPQADALPSRIDVGVSIAPKFAQLPTEARIRVAADIVSALRGVGKPGFRVGGEISWQERYEARAGYVRMENGASNSGPTFGVGIGRGRWQVDFAQMVTDVGSQAGAPPLTFISLRYSF